MKKTAMLTVCALAMSITGMASGQVYWTAGSDGYWTNALNWSGAAVPGASDDVVFNAGSAKAIIDQDITVRSLALTGTYAGAITFTQGVTADVTIAENLYICQGAEITVPFTSVEGEGRGRAFTIGGDAVINGKINADSCGFFYWTEGNDWPHGPGYDLYNTWGASHGGRSGTDKTAPYGSLTQPVSLGSGAYGTRGGGAIKLDVGGTLTINGTVTASSASGFHSGSGGSIWLICSTLAGDGLITASAANVSSGNGGGGGRVAIEAVNRTFSGKVMVSGGTGLIGNGRPGTLWDVNRFTAKSHVVINGDRYQYHFPPDAVSHVWGLTVTNGAAIHFLGYTNDVLTLTNVLVDGKSTLRFDMDALGVTMKTSVNKVRFLGGRLDVDGGSLVVLPQGEIGPPAVDVTVDGASSLYVASTNHVYNSLNIGSGSLFYPMVGNTADANPASGGTVANPHGSGTTIICQDAHISGTLNLSYRGFSPRTGPGRGRSDGWWDGGGYGGEGGHQKLPAPNSGLCYGSPFRPSALGSGASYNHGLRGGGAVLLVASNSLAINGTIQANGEAHGYGGSSGGSVWLVTRELSGAGRVTATGGNGNTGGSHGGGGGGRIAIEYVSGDFTITNNVACGQSRDSAAFAKTGTVFVCKSSMFGANSFGAAGRQLDTVLSIPNNNLQIARTIERWGQNMRWTDTSVVLSSGAPLTNQAVYTVSGLIPSGRYEIKLNDEPLGNGSIYASAEGEVVLEVELSDIPQTINLFEGSRCTVLILR